MCEKNNNFEQLDKYLKRYHKNITIKIIQNEEFQCIGDCLRKIFQKN